MSRHPLFIALLCVGLAPAAALAGKGETRPAAPAAVTVEEVGDADSFGRNIKWLGLASAYVRLSEDCTPPPGEPGDPSCITLNPAPAATNFRLPDLDVVTLPARSSRSLICHWQTPVIGLSLANPTAAPAPYTFRAAPIYRIQSAVLNEPGLVDPNTGLPYGGVIELALTSVYQAGTLAPGEDSFEQITGTRMCIGGLVSRASLIGTYGLSEAQADRFFREPITIGYGITGNARLVLDANINFGTRFAGD